MLLGFSMSASDLGVACPPKPRKPFFFGLPSSLSLTSSKPSSGGASTLSSDRRSWREDGPRVGCSARRESSDCRVGTLYSDGTGDRAEMSCDAHVQS